MGDPIAPVPIQSGRFVLLELCRTLLGKTSIFQIRLNCNDA